MLLGLSCISMLSPFNSEKKKKPQGFKAKNGYKQKNPTKTLKDQFYNQHNKLNRFECKFPANTFHHPRASAINSAYVLHHSRKKD